MKNKSTLSIIVFLLLAQFVIGQEATLSISDLQACENSEVIVPVHMENFYDVGAVSLFIGYDTTNLEFIGLENIHPAFDGLLYNAMNLPQPQIGISWTNVYGATVTSGVFFEMKFMYSGNSTNLDFNPGCEITTTELDPIYITYTGGTVTPIIIIMMQPEDQQVVVEESASFQIESSGGEIFQWQKSEPESALFMDIPNGSTYQGVNTETLQIPIATLLMHGKKYRCKITSGDCITYSDAALLTVEGMVQEIELAAGWNSLSTYINPTHTNLETLLDGIMNSLVILITDDGFYYPAANTNTIGNFDPNKGYALKLSNHETLSIAGLRTENHQINIPLGWSYLPVIVACNTSIQELFGGQIQDVIIIKELAGNNVFWPENNINTLQVLEPGKSYLIKTDNAILVNFPDCK